VIEKECEIAEVANVIQAKQAKPLKKKVTAKLIGSRPKRNRKDAVIEADLIMVGKRSRKAKGTLEGADDSPKKGKGKKDDGPSPKQGDGKIPEKAKKGDGKNRKPRPTGLVYNTQAKKNADTLESLISLVQDSQPNNDTLQSAIQGFKLDQAGIKKTGKATSEGQAEGQEQLPWAFKEIKALKEKLDAYEARIKELEQENTDLRVQMAQQASMIYRQAVKDMQGIPNSPGPSSSQPWTARDTANRNWNIPPHTQPSCGPPPAQ
jgi:hypothetical protein